MSHLLWHYSVCSLIFFIILQDATGMKSKSFNYLGLKNQVFRFEKTYYWVVFATKRPETGILQGSTSLRGYHGYSTADYNVYLKDGILQISLRTEYAPFDVDETTCEEFGILNDFNMRKFRFHLKTNKNKIMLNIRLGTIECITEAIASNFYMDSVRSSDNKLGVAELPGNNRYKYFYGCLNAYDLEPENLQKLIYDCDSVFNYPSTGLALRFPESSAEWTIGASSVGSCKSILSFDITNFGNPGTLCSISFSIYNMTVKLKEIDNNSVKKFCVIKRIIKLNTAPVEKCQIYSFSNTLKFKIESTSGFIINFNLGNATVVQFVNSSILIAETKIIIGDANVSTDNSVSIGNKSALGMLANIKTFCKEFNLATDLMWSNKISNYDVGMRQKRELNPCFQDTSATYNNNRRLNVRFECSKCQTSSCSDEDKSRSCLNPFKYTGKEVLMKTNFDGEEVPKISSTEQLLTMNITSVNSSQYTLRVNYTVGIDWTYFTYSNNSYLVKLWIDSTFEKPNITFPSGRILNVVLNDYFRIDERIIAIENMKNVSDALSHNYNLEVLSSSKYENVGSKGVNVVYKILEGRMKVVRNFTLGDVYAHIIFLGPQYSIDFSLVLSLDYFASEREIIAFNLAPTAKNLTVKTNTVNLLLGSRVIVDGTYISAEEFDTQGSKVISSFDVITFPKCGTLTISNSSNNNTFTLNEEFNISYISEKDCTEDYFEFRDHNGIDKSENKIFTLTFRLQFLNKSSVIIKNVYQQDSDDYIIDDSNVEIKEQFLSHPIAKFTILSVPTNGRLLIATGDGYKEVQQFDKFPLNLFKDRLLRYRFVCDMQSSQNVLLDELSLVVKAENGLILSNEIQLLFYSGKNHDNQPEVSFNLNLPWKFQSRDILRSHYGFYSVYEYKFKSQDFNITSLDTSSILYIKFNLYRLNFRSWNYIKSEKLMNFTYNDLLTVHPEFQSKEKPDIDSLKSFSVFTYLVYYDEIAGKNRAICFVNSAKFSL